jgi:uncharacterized protein YndB with AHSA1/START domain
MKVEAAGSEIVAEIEIAAPPETVFDALTAADQLAAWWGAEGMYCTHDWQIDLRPGGEWSCRATSASGDGMTLRGHYLEVDRPRILAYTWMPSWEPELPATEVRYTLSPIAGGTLVRMRHTGFEGFINSQNGHVEGWKRVFGWLLQYCSGKGMK